MHAIILITMPNQSNLTVENLSDIPEKGKMTNGTTNINEYRPISRYYCNESNNCQINDNNFESSWFFKYIIHLLLFRRSSIFEEVPQTTNAEIDYMSFDRISTTVQFLEKRTHYRPKISIICGSGLGKFIVGMLLIIKKLKTID